MGEWEDECWGLECLTCRKWFTTTIPTKHESRKIVYYGSRKSEDDPPLEVLEPLIVIREPGPCPKCREEKKKKPHV